MKAYVPRVCPAMTLNQVIKRNKFCIWWRKTGHNYYIVKIGKNRFHLPFMFSDEKLFVVDGGINKQNQRIYAFSREEADEIGFEFNLVC